jgi:hypothetical protein
VSSASLRRTQKVSIMTDKSFGTDQPEPNADHSQSQSSLSEEARAGIKNASASVQRSARSFAEEQKELAAERVAGVAQAIHDAAHNLGDRMPQASGLVQDAAAKLEDAASALRARNVDELTQSVSKFVRNQPLVFFGGAVFAGFALSRFLKSSAEKPTRQQKT